MKVKELIERLTLEDPFKRVVVNGYEEGYDEIDKILPVKVCPNTTKKDWEGELCHSLDENSESVILLPRKS